MLPLCGRDSSAPIKHAASSRSQDLVWRAPGTEGLKEDSFSVKMECFLKFSHLSGVRRGQSWEGRLEFPCGL